jgi:integrase
MGAVFKKITSRLVHGKKVKTESKTWYIRYNDGTKLREENTKCRDKRSAQQIKADREKRVERVRAGIVTKEEDRTLDHRNSSIDLHLQYYLDSLNEKKRTAGHIYMVKRILTKVVNECNLVKLSDFQYEPITKWIRERMGTVAPKSANDERVILVSFGNFLVEKERLTLNPMARLPRANESEKRHERRAFTREEFKRLLQATIKRPLIDATRVARGPNKGKYVAKVTDETTEQLKRLGWERGLIYQTLVFLSLRHDELSRITVDCLHLEANPPYVRLEPRHTKNKQGGEQPIRSDLVPQLKAWLEANPHLKGDSLLFNVPTGLLRIFNRDLKLAGINKKTSEGIVDIHALGRTTPATWLAQAGVPLAVAQKFMRHSTPVITANIYTKLGLKDLASAIEAVPDVALNVALELGRNGSD